MTSNLHTPSDKRLRTSQPASVVITRLLILIFLGPVCLGLVGALFLTAYNNPVILISLRGQIFFAVGFGLLIVFLFYGFRGLRNGDRHGYWIGLVFLFLCGIAGIYKLTLTLKKFSLADSNQAQDLFRSKELMLFDLSIQTVIVGLLLGLLLKFAFGKEEKMFFSRSQSAGSDET